MTARFTIISQRRSCVGSPRLVSEPLPNDKYFGQYIEGRAGSSRHRAFGHSQGRSILEHSASTVRHTSGLDDTTAQTHRFSERAVMGDTVVRMEKWENRQNMGVCKMYEIR